MVITAPERISTKEVIFERPEFVRRRFPERENRAPESEPTITSFDKILPERVVTVPDKAS